MHELPIGGLELFMEYDPKDTHNIEVIRERIKSVQKNHAGKNRNRLLEDGNIGVPRIATRFAYYPVIKELFGHDKVFVDGGCGLGTDLRRVIKDGIHWANAIGITNDPEEIEWGYELYGDRWKPGHCGRYIVCDLRSIEMENESVDIFYNYSVIHTLGKKESVLAFLNEAKRVLKKCDGLLSGTTQGDYKEIDGPHYGISEDALRKYLLQLGFKDVHVTTEIATKPITWKYVSGHMKSDEPRMAPEPLKLHYIARI